MYARAAHYLLGTREENGRQKEVGLRRNIGGRVSGIASLSHRLRWEGRHLGLSELIFL